MRRETIRGNDRQQQLQRQLKRQLKRRQKRQQQLLDGDLADLTDQIQNCGFFFF
jgi:hypothetical protein